MTVSIIIVNLNTCDILRNCLRSIYEQAGKVDFEIIVIDNASEDDSVLMVKTEFPKVILIENQQNLGFATANNQGIAIARGRYVLLLNSDTVVLDNAIARTISFADINQDSAIIGCRVLNPDMTVQPTCFMFPSLLNLFLSSTYLYKLFPRNRFFGRERMAWWNRDDVRQIDAVTGCFMLVRRQAIEQVGLLDSQFFMYAEETDWCYRFKKAGWKILFTPDAKIIHLGAASSRQKQSEMTLQLRGSTLLFIKKHKSQVVYVFACFLVAMFFFLRVPYWLVRSLFSRGNRRDKLNMVYTYINGAFKALSGAHSLCAQR